MSGPRPPPKTTVCEAAIIALSLNVDATQLAFSPNNHVIFIADVSGAADCTKWSITHTLEGLHGQAVSGIHWGHKTNRLVSCAQDRTCFVWSLDATGQWVPAHVMLDANVKRGLTCVRWNSTEERIYIGSAACNVAVGRFDDEQNFWTCTVVQPHLSTVTCLAPHPTDDRLLATGSTDCTVKLTPVKGKAPAAVAVFQLKAWVNALEWNADGTVLVAATHDARVHIMMGADPAAFVATSINLRGLALRSVAFVVDPTSGQHLIVGGGHDCYPVALGRRVGGGSEGNEGSTWAVVGAFATTAKGAPKELSATEAARQRFQNEAALGQVTAAADSVKTKHTNTITAVAALPPAQLSSRGSFLTASLDGKVEFWKLTEMSGDLI